MSIKFKHQISDFLPFPPDLLPWEPAFQVQREVKVHHGVLKQETNHYSPVARVHNR